MRKPGAYPPPYENYRIFLTHYPVADADITSFTANGAVTTEYEIENASGKLSLNGAAASDEIIVAYTGGYDLPDEAPPALKQAAQLVIQAGYAQLLRALIPASGAFLTRKLA